MRRKQPMARKIKSKETTAGGKANCPDYKPCPLCYGCRNYDPSYYKCVTTCKGTKYDTCDTHRHNDKALSLMIRRPEVTLD